MAEPIYRVSDNGLGSLVAVGANGLILLSTDNGTTWNAKFSGTSEHLYGAAYGDWLGETGWIVVGANGTILYSPAGNTWYTKSTPITEDLYDVAYGGIFIAVGANGFMASSEDFGDNWLLNESGTTEDLYSIEIDFSSYIIVGAGDTVITGEVLSLNFNIECIENINVSESTVNNQTRQLSVNELFEVVAPVAGRVAGQVVEFDFSGTFDLGDQYRITLDGVNYDYTVAAVDDLHESGVVTTGGTPVGTIANIDVQDTTYWQIPEVTGVPGFDVRIKYGDVDPGTLQFRFNGRYEGNAGHTVDIQAWNFTTQAWQTIDAGDSFVHSVTDQALTLEMDEVNHVSDGGELGPDGLNAEDGDVWVRFYHSTTGNATHNLYIDKAVLIDTPTTMSDVAAGMSEVINKAGGKFDAHHNAGETSLIVSSHVPPTSYTYSSSVLADVGTIDAAIDETFIQNSSGQKVSFEFTGTVEAGDLFRIIIDSFIFPYTVQGGDVTMSDVAAGWYASQGALLEGLGDGFDVTVSGAVVTIETHNAAKAFTYSKSVFNGGATDDQDLDILLVQSATLEGSQFYEYQVDSFDMINESESAEGVFNHVLTETIDTLDTFIGNLNANVTVTDSVLMGDTIAFELANGYGGNLTLIPLTLEGEFLAGNSMSGSLRLPAMRIAGALVRELGGDLVLPMITIDGKMGADVAISGDLILPQLQIDGQLIITVDDTDYVVWVVNRDNKAHSNYESFKANSLVTFNGVDLVATEDGIYELQAQEDDYEGTIDARVMWVPTDYGSSTLKRLDAAYVNLRHATGGLIRTVADEIEERLYECDMAEHAEGMHKKRVLLVRGLAGEFWEVGFESTEGSFTLGDIEVTPVASKRRIK